MSYDDTSYNPPVASAPAGNYANIIRTRGRTFEYKLTPEDVGWAAKMAAFEGDPAYVLWTMTQRFVLTYPGQRWSSFAYFIRKFSQPINPDWYRHGQHCQPGGKGAGTVYCSEEKLAKREQIAQMSWAELEAEQPEAVRITLLWAQGRLKNPVPKAVNFAAPSRAQWYMEQKPEAELIAKAENWYLTEMGSQHWHPNTVVMRQPETNTVAMATPETPAERNVRLFVKAFVNPTSLWGGKRVA